MDLIQAYGSPPGGKGAGKAHARAVPELVSLAAVDAAPEVDTAQAATAGMALALATVPSTARMGATRLLSHNLSAEEMWAPVQGPQHPYLNDGISRVRTNMISGQVDSVYVDPAMFDAQRNSFNVAGAAIAPGSGALYAPAHDERRAGARKPEKDVASRKRKLNNDPASAGYAGPWADYDDVSREIVITPEHAEFIARAKLHKKNADADVASATPAAAAAAADAAASAESAGEGEAPGAPAASAAATAGASAAEVTDAGEQALANTLDGNETSEFHGESLTDYQGRSWLAPPSDLKPADVPCYLPKTVKHTFKGHGKGISAIELFPVYGHLLLTASMDGKVKLWDVLTHKRVMRTFSGHSKAVRTACFNHDGTRILSCGYDNVAKLWDTETGACLQRYHTETTPLCARFGEGAFKNELVIGTKSGKILHFNVDSAELMQKYAEHLGPVSSLAIIEGGARLISTSDDKSIRVWDWGVPVQIKVISEPYMHGISATALHPSTRHIACQSANNQLLVYSSHETFALNKKKRFLGHTSASYAIEPCFSPDGQFVASGDSTGSLWFWSWRNSQKLTVLGGHKSVVITCRWHPILQSTVFTGSWDGTVKMWQ